MAVALAIQKVDVSRRQKRIFYGATFSGNYATGGDTLDFAAATNPKFEAAAYPSRAPDVIIVHGAPGGNPAEGVLGTDMTNSLIKMFSASDTELGAGAYNAAVTGDGNIVIEAVWRQGV